MPGHAGTSGLPAVIPGQGATGPDGFQPWGHVPITGYGDSAPAAGGGGGSSGGEPPNWTFYDPSGDEPFNRPSAVPLMPGGDAGGGPHLGMSDLLFRGAMLDYAGHIVADAYNNAVADPAQQITGMRLKDTAFSSADAEKVRAAGYKIVDQAHGMSLVGAYSLILKGYSQTHDAVRLQNSGRDDAVDGITQIMQAAEAAGTLNTKNPDGSLNIDPFTNWIDYTTRILQSDPMVSTNDVWLATQQNDLGALMNDQTGQSEQDILAGMLGGFKSGTGAAQLNREMIGGKMSTGTFAVLEKLGLVDGHGATKTGQYYTLRPGALVDEKTFAANPVEWFQKDFQPAVDRMSPNDPGAMFHDIIAGTGTASGARSAVEYVFQEALIARMLEFAMHDEPGDAQSQAIIDQNPATSTSYLMHNLAVLGNRIMATPDVVNAENWFGHELNELAGPHPLNVLWKNSVNQAASFFGGANPFSNPFSKSAEIPAPSALSDLEGFVSELRGFLRRIAAGIEGQPGKTPGSALYTKEVPAGPTVPQSNKPTSRNTALSPPLPGRVNRTP